MWCLRARRLISAFVDHELDPATDSHLSAHFRRCGWCRRMLERVQQGARLAHLSRSVSFHPPDMGMLANIQAMDRGGLPQSQAGPRWLLPAVSTAVLLLTFAIFNSPTMRNFWPFGKNSTVHALDFGPNATQADDDLLNIFRARYAGKFQEFPYDGKLDHNWVPFRFKHASNP